MAVAERGSAVARVLAVRARSFGRVLLGLPRADPVAFLFVLAFLAAAARYGWVWSRTERGSLAVAVVAVGVVALAHTGREDERFLRLAGAAHRRVFAAEYLFLALPFSLLLVTGARPAYAAGVAGAALLLPLLPSGGLRAVGPRLRPRPVRVPLPPAAFEWISGLRRNGVAVLVVYVLALLLWRLPAASLFGPPALTWVLTEPCFVEGESWMLVEAFALPPRRFLRDKLRRSVLLFWAACSPLVLLVLVREPRAALVVALLLAGCSLVHAGGVLFRYATYHEGRRTPVAGTLTLLVLAATLALPPVALFLLYRLWRQAVRNLEPYLYAFD